MEETKETECCIMTNEEYRERLNYIFSKIHRNDVLRYYYTFVSEKEKIGGRMCYEKE